MFRAVQELGMQIIEDEGTPAVAIMDEKRRVRIGNRQASGKQKAVRGK